MRSIALLASLVVVSSLIAGAVGFPLAAAGSAEHPDVVDDPSADPSIPPDLNVISGWVGNETSTAFSTFMKVQVITPPSNASRAHYYHFHFQVELTDGSTALYHAMVHHEASGAWRFMTQQWVPTGGTGVWADTNLTSGNVDVATGTIEVRVPKAVVVSPKRDIQHNSWQINHFYIHADEVDAATGQVLESDTAPAAGTVGAYDVSVGAPVQSGGPSPAPGAAAGLAAIAAVAALLVWRARRAT